jgi:chromosome segregation ATPase
LTKRHAEELTQLNKESADAKQASNATIANLKQQLDELQQQSDASKQDDSALHGQVNELFQQLRASQADAISLQHTFEEHKVQSSA